MSYGRCKQQGIRFFRFSDYPSKTAKKMSKRFTDRKFIPKVIIKKKNQDLTVKQGNE